MKNVAGKAVYLILCILLVLIIPQLASAGANRIYPLFSGTDPDGTFL